MHNLLTHLKSAWIAVSIGVSSFFGFNHAPATVIHAPASMQEAPTLGSSAPVFVAAKPTFLFGGGINSSATSIKLTSLVTPAGAAITTAQLVGGPNQVYYATIEPSTTKKETVSCTGVTQNGDGTALMTGCTRGLQFTTPYTASTTLAIAHNGGSGVVISNSPQVYNDIVNDAVSLTRSSSITGQLTLSSTTPPKYDANPSFNSFASTTLASIGYVASTSFAGTVDASEIQKGISELATKAEASAGTSLGSTLARLVLPASIATSTCQVATTSVLVASSTTGKLHSGCFDTAAPYTFTGSNIFTASSTFTATTTLATTTVNGILVSPKFGGTGSDGALTISSGTTTIALGSQAVFVKNYTSISITGTGVLTFSGASATGTVIVLKSQGNVTLTSNAQAAIQLSGLGATATNNATGFIYYSGTSAGGTGGASTGGTGGTGATIPFNQNAKYLSLMPGAGGGNASAGAATGGTGGGSIYIEVGGTYNATSTLIASGTNGVNGVGAAPGGGGGGGGSIVVLYNNLTANTSTYTASGGIGGTGDTGSNAGGAGGTARTIATGSGTGGSGANTAAQGTGGGGGAGRGGNTGSNGTGGSGGPSSGGGGGGGSFYVVQNTEFN